MKDSDELLTYIYAVFTDVRLDVENRQPAKVYAENAQKLKDKFQAHYQPQAVGATELDELTLWAEISNLHELLWTDAINFKRGYSKYDKISTVNSVNRQVKAKVMQLLTERQHPNE